MEKKNTPAAIPSTNGYEVLEDWARSRVQVWLQELLEDEVTQFLGREKSERSADRRRMTGLWPAAVSDVRAARHCPAAYRRGGGGAAVLQHR